MVFEISSTGSKIYIFGNEMVLNWEQVEELIRILIELRCCYRAIYLKEESKLAKKGGEE